jgi:hypothetical protein
MRAERGDWGPGPPRRSLPRHMEAAGAPWGAPSPSTPCLPGRHGMLGNGAPHAYLEGTSCLLQPKESLTGRQRKKPRWIPSSGRCRGNETSLHVMVDGLARLPDSSLSDPASGDPEWEFELYEACEAPEEVARPEREAASVVSARPLGARSGHALEDHRSPRRKAACLAAMPCAIPTKVRAGDDMLELWLVRRPRLLRPRASGTSSQGRRTDRAGTGALAATARTA